VKMSTRNISWG